MHVVHVVTYVSKDGAFGGPVAVALAQLGELAKRGHSVELVGGWDGEVDIVAPGVTVSLFEVKKLMPLGFSGLWAPGLLPYLRRVLTRSSVVHIHAGRDLITLLAAAAVRRIKSPYVIQTHGMIAPRSSLAVQFLDAILTRKVLRGAQCVLVLTGQEESDVGIVSRARAGVRRIGNGFARPMLPPGRSRRTNEVLFLARLHPRKRVLAFVEMAAILSRRKLNASFVVVGPDEGDLALLRDRVELHGLESLLNYEGALSTGRSVERLSRGGVFVLPSFGEVFPMTVLEAMAAETPVVTTNQSGIADLLLERNAALVTDGSPHELADAVEKILTDERTRKELTTNADALLSSTFSISSVVDGLVEVYESRSK